MRKNGLPSKNEIVICKITKIYPNSASATLLEYGKDGMIHVSEVASRWVRNIREFVKENQFVVCRVMFVDDNNIELSVKRVYKEDAGRKLNEFKREGKAEKMLELAAEGMKKSIEDAYDEIGGKVEEEFGSLTKLFDTSLKNPGLLKDKGIPDKWANAITDVAKKKFVEKTYESKIELVITCNRPDGIEVIKSVISKNVPKDLEIRYVSAPGYVLTGTGKNHKQLRMLMEQTAESIAKDIGKQGGECSFKFAE